MTSFLATHPYFVAGASIGLTAAVSAYQWLMPRPLSNFPHNPITSIWGDVPELMSLIKDEDVSVLQYFALLVKRHGPVVQMCLGKKIILLLADPVEIDRLYVQGKNVDASTTMTAVFKPLIPTALISLQMNDMWKRHKRIMGPTMHRRYLSRMASHVSTAANALVALWGAKMELAKGDSFEAAQDLKLTTMDGVTSILTGSSLGALEAALDSLSVAPAETSGAITFAGAPVPPICAAIINVMSGANLGAQLPFPAFTFPLYLLVHPSWWRDRDLLRSYLWERVEAAKARQGGLKKGELATDADCVIDMLVREIGEGLTKNEMQDELVQFIIGGQETTAASTGWFVKYVAADFDIQRRLHNEIHEVFGAGPIDSLAVLEDPSKVPILEAVTVETLRCATVAGGSRRELINDEVIMGRLVPKGTDIIALTGLLGFSEAEWGPDAQKWRPSRWLRPDGSFNRDAGPTGNPFGLGAKACFGQKLAVMQLKIFIATLSRSFVFKSVTAGLDSFTPITLISNQPKICYVSLERWE